MTTSRMQLLGPHQVRQVAVQAVCDPKTVQSFMAGRPVRSTTRTRVEAALRELGLPSPAQAEQSGPQSKGGQ